MVKLSCVRFYQVGVTCATEVVTYAPLVPDIRLDMFLIGGALLCLCYPSQDPEAWIH